MLLTLARNSASVVVHFLLSLFITIIAVSPVNWLKGKGLHSLVAVLLFLLQMEPMMLVVIAIYLAVNTVMGNLIEPAIMGQHVGLSTLSVFLSLIFWGWLFGPVGMLLSVPLTMVVKFAADSNPQTRWFAILLGNASSPESVCTDGPVENLIIEGSRDGEK